MPERNYNPAMLRDAALMYKDNRDFGFRAMIMAVNCPRTPEFIRVSRALNKCVEACTNLEKQLLKIESLGLNNKDDTNRTDRCASQDERLPGSAATRADKQEGDQALCDIHGDQSNHQ